MSPLPNQLDQTIHPPKRLSIMATLRRTSAVDFRFLQQQLEITESDLSKQMKTLIEAGYVRATKRGRGPKSSTWFRATAAGRRAFDAHTAALQTLIALDDDISG